MTKPFGLLELMARIAALLRRAESAHRPGPSRVAERFGDVEVDCSTRTVRVREQLIMLRPMEFDLLVALLQRRGAVASRLDLLKEVWGHSAAAHPDRQEDRLQAPTLTYRDEKGAPADEGRSPKRKMRRMLSCGCTLPGQRSLCQAVKTIKNALINVETRTADVHSARRAVAILESGSPDPLIRRRATQLFHIC